MVVDVRPENSGVDARPTRAISGGLRSGLGLGLRLRLEEHIGLPGNMGIMSLRSPTQRHEHQLPVQDSRESPSAQIRPDLGHSTPSTMRKSRSTPSERAASASW
ncbi:hypothetical protein CP973_16715 [Streptomyces albofaciens JCM 4342]|nr:hypothetical protein CP973_16715 [Streptomyces albofaciens JCM 4342]